MFQEKKKQAFLPCGKQLILIISSIILPLVQDEVNKCFTFLSYPPMKNIF